MSKPQAAQTSKTSEATSNGGAQYTKCVEFMFFFVYKIFSIDEARLLEDTAEIAELQYQKLIVVWCAGKPRRAYVNFQFIINTLQTLQISRTPLPDVRGQNLCWPRGRKLLVS